MRSRLARKRCRQWRVLRWLAVACFILGVGLLVCAGYTIARMHTTMELPKEALTFPENPGSKLLASSITMIAAHDDAQVVVLRAEVYLVLKVVLVAGGGTALFVYAVSDWRRDRRDRVISKLLRSLASSETGDEGHGS